MYYICSDKSEGIIDFVTVFRKDIIFDIIKTHLSTDPDDTVSLERDLSPSERKKYFGRHIIDFFRLNKNGDICKVVTKGDKEYLKRVIVPQCNILGRETFDSNPEAAYHAIYG